MHYPSKEDMECQVRSGYRLEWIDSVFGTSRKSPLDLLRIRDLVKLRALVSYFRQLFSWIKHKGSDQMIGAFVFYEALWQRGRVLSKILVTICIANRTVGIRDGQVAGCGLSIDDIVSVGDDIKVTHLMDDRTGF